MNTLENIGNLVERLAGKIDSIADGREAVLLEINRLRERLVQRDKEAVQALHKMRAELESARVSAMRFELEWTRTNVKLQGLNDRLTSLVNAVSLPASENSEKMKNISEAEKTLGGAAGS